MTQRYFPGMAPDGWPTALRRARRRLRRLLRTGQAVAMEDVLRDIHTAEDIDRRRFGQLITQLHRDGEIERAGYRESLTARHHAGTKALWRLTKKAKGAGHE